MSPGLRDRLALNAVSAVAGAAAALAVASSHSIDLYALIDQLNITVAEFGKIVALMTPGVTLVITWIKSTRRELVKDVASVPGTRVLIPEQSIADSLPSNVLGPSD